MKRDPIVLSGVVLGRAVARIPLDRRGLPMAASHDREVTLTLQFPVPNERPLEFSMRLDSLPRGWMEIGDAVRLTLAAVEPSVAIPRVLTSSEGEPYTADTPLPDAIADVKPEKTEPYSVTTPEVVQP